jgi:hyaluronan synthase
MKLSSVMMALQWPATAPTLGSANGCTMARSPSGSTKLSESMYTSISASDRSAPSAIVQPFADPKVGAVAGHCNAIITEDSFISKMEAVRYYVSQRILKASESVYWAVTCCPGPFSAYRRDAVMRILPAWRTQTFLGTEATFGDDRSLTNYILRDYRVVYHAGAVTATYVPATWTVFLRQQLRWKKSWARETTIAARRMWRKHPVAAFSYYTNVLITVASPVIATKALLALPTAAGSLAFFPYMLGLVLMYLLFGLVYRIYTGQPRWYYGVAFAFLYIGVLAFQNYYAMLTVRRNHWGTR